MPNLHQVRDVGNDPFMIHVLTAMESSMVMVDPPRAVRVGEEISERFPLGGEEMTIQFAPLGRGWLRVTFDSIRALAAHVRAGRLVPVEVAVQSQIPHSHPYDRCVLHVPHGGAGRVSPADHALLTGPGPDEVVAAAKDTGTYELRPS